MYIKKEKHRPFIRERRLIAQPYGR